MPKNKSWSGTYHFSGIHKALPIPSLCFKLGLYISHIHLPDFFSKLISSDQEEYTYQQLSVLYGCMIYGIIEFGTSAEHFTSLKWFTPTTGELGYDGPLYDGFSHMTDNMLGPSPLHIKYSSYVYDRCCIWRTNFPGPIESVISKSICTDHRCKRSGTLNWAVNGWMNEWINEWMRQEPFSATKSEGNNVILFVENINKAMNKCSQSELWKTYVFLLESVLDR